MAGTRATGVGGSDPIDFGRAAIDVLRCDKCGGRMKPIAEITERRVARKMLEHVGVPSDAPEPCPARGPPEWVESAPGSDDEPRATHHDSTWPDVE